MGDIGGMAEKVPDNRSGLQFSHGSLASFLSVLEKAADPALYADLCRGIPTPPDSVAMADAYRTLIGKEGAVAPVATAEPDARSSTGGAAAPAAPIKFRRRSEL